MECKLSRKLSSEIIVDEMTVCTGNANERSVNKFGTDSFPVSPSPKIFQKILALNAAIIVYYIGDVDLIIVFTQTFFSG